MFAGWSCGWCWEHQLQGSVHFIVPKGCTRAAPQTSPCIQLVLHQPSPNAPRGQGTKGLGGVCEHRKGLTDMAASALAVFSEANASGLQRNQESSAARDIPHFPPVCAYQWVQLLTSVADFLWICVFWWETMLFASSKCHLIPPPRPIRC